jgi:tRNA-Thr(GGU) m(6)t(6)A37 methyltransferase TsaA
LAEAPALDLTLGQSEILSAVISLIGIGRRYEMDLVAGFRAKPIGIVEDGVPREKSEWPRKSRYQVTSRVRVYEHYADGLTGLDDYSNIIVVWWMREEKEVRLRVTPWGRPDMPEVGIFATRFPTRPNHLGISVVQLLEVSRNVLTVKGLDAWTGSPVLDIKPYDYYDIARSARVPDWFRRYWEEHSVKRNAAWLGP